MRTRRFIAMTMLLLASACGSSNDAPPAPELPGERSVSLPAPVPIADALRVDLRRPASDKQLRSVEKLWAVALVSEVSIDPFTVTSRGEKARLQIVAVDPVSFRSFAPAPTRDADFVWTALASGGAVITPQGVKDLRFRDPGNIRIRTRPIVVGAFADNGTPNLGDVLLARGSAPARGGTQVLLVGARDGVSLDRMARDLRSRLSSVVKISRLTPQPSQAVPADPADPVGRAEGDLIGAMTFRILKSGYIEPDPAWVAANIASGTVPILGDVTCHRLVFPQLAAALSEIEERGLEKKIHPADFGGCYVPRFIDRDPRRGLSMHAFGLALDLNVSDNYYGTVGRLDPRVVSIFEKWGFAWGGRWSTPDPMHMELARLIDP